jgi:hypothetical protein
MHVTHGDHAPDFRDRNATLRVTGLRQRRVGGWAAGVQPAPSSPPQVAGENERAVESDMTPVRGGPNRLAGHGAAGGTIAPWPLHPLCAGRRA